MATTATTPPASSPKSPKSPTFKSKSPSPAGALVEESAEAADAARQLEEGNVEIDSAHGDDPGYETDTNSSIGTSLSSSVRNFVHENGRTYHSFRQGKYAFPNDEAERDREDMKHAMVLNLLSGKLHLAPFKEEGQVIDLGTGTGIWCMEMGDMYPSASILGVDFSPIQPPWVPPNVSFMIDDVESPWPQPLNHFDYVHARHMAPAFKDWGKVLGESYEHLKPGGWIEFQEMDVDPRCSDDSMTDAYIVKQYLTAVEQGMARLGVELNACRRVAEMLRNAGFVNVTERIYNIPIGIWPRNKVLKTLGLYLREVILSSLQGIAFGGLHRGLGWSVQDVELYLVDVRTGLNDARVHSFLPYYVVYGQKPGN